jgi:hypothetical protein
MKQDILALKYRLLKKILILEWICIYYNYQNKNYFFYRTCEYESYSQLSITIMRTKIIFLQNL